MKALSTKHRKHYQITNEDQILDEKKHEKELQLRRVVRRFYLMFSLAENASDVDHVMDQVFGSLYTEYRKLILERQSRNVLKIMKNKIFDALYMKNTGFLPTGNEDLPLTLRREDDVFQNVMIVLGELTRSDLSVVQVKATSKFEDVDNKHELVFDDGGKVF